MVKKIILSVLIFNFFYSYSQNERRSWWLKTALNKKYEENYKYAISKMENDILKEQIEKFINYYISNTYRENNEIAIEVIILDSKIREEETYNITFKTNYYEGINDNPNIQQIVEIKNRIVFIKNEKYNNIKIDNEILFGLLRNKFKEDCDYLNRSYEKLKNENLNGIPVIFNTEHNIPKWLITIKDGKLIRKEETFE